MAEHLVQLWIRSDDDPSGIDWQAWLPKGVQVERVQTRTFPWQDVQHEITWWITRRLTMEEWSALDAAESEVLARIVGDDHFEGMAGPIPFPESTDEKVDTSLPGVETQIGAISSHEPEDAKAEQAWRPITPEHWALYELAKKRARPLMDDAREEVAAVAGDSFRMADEALALWGSIDALTSLAEEKRAESALLRRGIDDAIHALTHLMKQSGKPDQSEIVSRVVQIVVPRLHQVLAGEDPYDS